MTTPASNISHLFTKEQLIQKIESCRISKRLAIQAMNQKEELYQELKEKYDKLLAESKEKDDSTAHPLPTQHDSCQQNYARLEKSYRYLETNFKTVQERYQHLYNKAKHMQQMNKSLEATHKSLQEAYDSLLQSNTGNQESSDLHQTYVDMIDALRSEHAKEIAKHEQQYQELRKADKEAIESTRKKMQVQHTKIMTQIRQIKDLNQALNEERSKSQSAEAESSQLSLVLETREDTIKELNRQVNLLKQQNTALETTLKQNKTVSTISPGSMMPQATASSASTTTATATTTATVTTTNTQRTHKRPLENAKENPRLPKKPAPLSCITNARHRNGREQLKGEACSCCKGFYDGDSVLAVHVGGNVVQVTPEERIQQHSRHRVSRTRASTPPGFWEIEFGSPPDA